MPNDVRWKQRFENFDRAVLLLREPFERPIEGLSDLEKAGTIQRFEMAIELAWKVLKDYLENEGVVIQPLTPRNVIKEAFAARLLSDGQIWIDMLDQRNLLSHTYDKNTFEKIITAIHVRYLPALLEAHDWFMKRKNLP